MDVFFQFCLPNIQEFSFLISILDHYSYLFMPSSNHRSSSVHSSRRASNRLQVHVVRSASVPQRQFIFILTNNPELLRHTQDLQVQVK